MTDIASPYCYEGTTVYRNRLGIRDQALLEQAESITTTARMADLALTPIDGHFDFTHLQQIHRYVMADVYDWAGETRTVQTFAGDTGIPHDPPEAIPEEADRIFAELADADYLRGRGRAEFTTGLAEHWGDLTSLHPFVDGNSRTQRLFVDQLSRQAGWEIDWHAVSPAALQAARNIAFLDAGKILHDVLQPAIVQPGAVPAIAVAQPGRETQMTVTDHWRSMLDHVESTPDQPYTWASQHTSPDRELNDLTKLVAQDFPSTPRPSRQPNQQSPTAARKTPGTRSQQHGHER
ncbi:hypothetical protein GS504_03370 [Rhodococcus hoagii]|nr:hypothetical protein [Prescottella equi]NKS56596.1 hypothetical protein [Prescottella equi]